MKVSTLGGILLGNLLIVIFFWLTHQFIKVHAFDWRNVLVTSLLFFTITVLSLLLVRYGIKRSDQFPVIGVIYGLVFIRLVVSLGWLLLLRHEQGSVYGRQLVAFMLIYLYYLYVDAVLLDRIVRPSEENKMS